MMVALEKRRETVSELKARKELLGIVKRPGIDKGFWTRIGTAFENKDGSWTLLFDYLPTNPETGIQMREPRPKEGHGGDRL